MLSASSHRRSRRSSLRCCGRASERCAPRNSWFAFAQAEAIVGRTAGGLGVIAAAQFTPAELKQEIRRVRDLTDKPFGVDILFATVRAAGEEAERFTDAVRGWADVTLEARVPVLAAGLGNPGPITADGHRQGMKVMAWCLTR
mgnify:CR=1 FL=1